MTESYALIFCCYEERIRFLNNFCVLRMFTAVIRHFFYIFYKFLISTREHTRNTLLLRASLLAKSDKNRYTRIRSREMKMRERERV